MARADDGSPVLVIKVCKGHIDTVSIYAFRDGLSADQPNRLLASWTSHHRSGNTIELPVNDPPESWKPDPSTTGPFPVRGKRGFIVLAQSSTTDAEVTQVSFRGRELRGLSPGQVLIRDSQVSTRAAFDHDACAAD
ncbi:MAG: hypothetical protein QM747_12885 [Nocardioides sp.]